MLTSSGFVATTLGILGHKNLEAVDFSRSCTSGRKPYRSPRIQHLKSGIRFPLVIVEKAVLSKWEVCVVGFCAIGMLGQVQGVHPRSIEITFDPASFTGYETSVLTGGGKLAFGQKERTGLMSQSGWAVEPDNRQ